jgi:hypothetical protein
VPFPEPLEMNRVVADSKLAEVISILIKSIRPDAPLGGLTIGLPRNARALVYVGPLPEHIDKVVRYLAKPHGFNVSAVRNKSQFLEYETATAHDPKNY